MEVLYTFFAFREWTSDEDRQTFRGVVRKGSTQNARIVIFNPDLLPTFKNHYAGILSSFLLE